MGTRLKALYDYNSGAPGELAFATGDIMILVEDQGDWLKARLGTQVGLIPGNYVERMTSPPPAAARAPPALREPTKVSTPAAAYQATSAPAASAGGGGGGGGGGGKGGGGGGGGGRARRPKFNQRFALFAHNLALFGGWSLLILSPTGLEWYDTKYLYNLAPEAKLIQSAETGQLWAIIGTILGLVVVLYEGLWGMKRLEILGQFPIRGIMYFLAGGAMFATWPTLFGGLGLLVSGVFNTIASSKGENGDATGLGKSLTQWDSEGADDKEESGRDGKIMAFIKRKTESGTLGQLVFTFLYIVANIVIGAQRASVMIGAVAADQALPHVPDATYGKTYQLDEALIWAKIFGQLLNFNCAILLLPVCRVVLRAVNNVDVIGKLIPLRKNIIFHKMIASVVLLCTVGHVVAHYVNYARAPYHLSHPPADISINAYSPSKGIWWVTGGIIMIAMLAIYSGAREFVKRAYYEVFWISHHFFILFYMPLFQHGPKFYQWAALPVLLYILERVLRIVRGNTTFYLRYVEWRPPVMQLQFAPQLKDWFKFKEGQYLYLNAPYLSSQEWHPFTISSAYEDLIMEDFTSLHIRIQPGGWTERLKDYLATMAGKSGKEAFSSELMRRNEKGEQVVGKHLGPDNKPLIRVDGPHPAPAQHYDEYNTVMLVGAGIGLTPSAAIIRAVLRHKWKKGFPPDILHFYWVLRHSEIKSFLWFVELLTALEKGVASDRAAGSLGGKYIEMNIFVTRAPKTRTDISNDPSYNMGMQGLQRPGLLPSGIDVDIGFGCNDLLEALVNPTVSSKQHTQVITDPDNATNRLQDIWVWNGRPDWDQIFQGVRAPPCPHKDICVAFCGTPIIGKDLKKMCNKYSDVDTQVLFHLHKENF